MFQQLIVEATLTLQLQQTPRVSPWQSVPPVNETCSDHLHVAYCHFCPDRLSDSVMVSGLVCSISSSVMIFLRKKAEIIFCLLDQRQQKHIDLNTFDLLHILLTRIMEMVSSSVNNKKQITAQVFKEHKRYFLSIISIEMGKSQMSQRAFMKTR